MRFLVMFVTAVCVLFLIKLRWPKKKNFYDTGFLLDRGLMSGKIVENRAGLFGGLLTLIQV